MENNTSLKLIQRSHYEVFKMYLKYQLHGAQLFFRSWQWKFPTFMEPPGSLQFSQEPDTGPYHEPDKFSPQLSTLILILSSHLRQVLPSGLFHSVFLTKICYSFLMFPVNAICPIHLIYPNNIWWSVQVMMLLIMQSSPASCHFLLGPNILLSTLFSNPLNLFSTLSVTDLVSYP